MGSAATAMGPVNMLAIHRGLIGGWRHTLACRVSSVTVSSSSSPWSSSCDVVVTTGTAGVQYFLNKGFTENNAEDFAHAAVGNAEKGWVENLCAKSSHSDSWWDDFIGGIEDIVSFAASLVDNFADAYATVKAAVISSVCGGNSDCETVMSAGVDAGLAALGVPPSIPNFNQLDGQRGQLPRRNHCRRDRRCPLTTPWILPRRPRVFTISPPARKMCRMPEIPMASSRIRHNQNQPARLMVQLENDDPVNSHAPGRVQVLGFLRPVQDHAA